MDTQRGSVSGHPIVDGWWRWLYDARIDPCPQCGAWKWADTMYLWQRDRLRCGECHHEADIHDLHAGGRD